MNTNLLDIHGYEGEAHSLSMKVVCDFSKFRPYMWREEEYITKGYPSKRPADARYQLISAIYS